MKKHLILLLIGLLTITEAYSQFKVRSDNYIQIGYDDYRVLTFGEELNTPNNGKYAIEHWDQGVTGLNFWKSWPTANSGNYILYLRDDKKVGINGTGSSSYTLSVHGNAWNWYGTWSGSDRRFKTNIKPLSNSLEKVLQLQGVSYIFDAKLPRYSGEEIANEKDPIKQSTMENDRWITSGAIPSIGFIAQDVEEIVPEAIKIDEEGYYAMNYDEIIPLLVEAIKEQQEQIENLKESSLKRVINESEIEDRSNEILKDQSNSFLYYNRPNPFNGQTTISYHLDNTDLHAVKSLQIFDQLGHLIKEIELTNVVGKNDVVVSNNEIGTGVFNYALIIDGFVIDTKTMICRK